MFAVGGEDGVVTVVERQLDFERAVVLQFGRSVAADRIALVKAAPVKKDDAPAVFEFGGSLDFTTLNSAQPSAPICK